MRATGLAARLAYALVALPAGIAAGFYGCVWLQRLTAPMDLLPNPATDGETLFKVALTVGALVALPAFLMALTLPWKRRRQRRGRTWRTALSCVVVVGASLAFAGMGHKLVYDLLFAGWLGYMLALTFVRYGVVDHRRERTLATEPDED